MMMMMMMRPNAFIHSFIHSREREREKARKVFGQSSWPLVAARKRKQKRNETRGIIAIFRRRLRRRRRGIKETKKRERNWSQRHKGTHFFHHLMGFER